MKQNKESDSIEKRFKYLISKGFKKKWFRDRSGWWVELPVIIDYFKGNFMFDGQYCHIEIETLIHHSGDNYEKSKEIIWKGSWKTFLNKLNKYN